MFFGVSCQSGTTRKKTSGEQVKTLIAKYRECEGFETVQLGGLATIALRMAIASSASEDEETAKALDALKGLKKFSVVNYMECEERVREKVRDDLKRIISDSEMIMEVKSEGESFSMYGIVDETDKTVKDIILFMPDSYTFICCTGSISTEELTTIATESD